MTGLLHRLGRGHKTAFAAALLAGTALATGGIVWSNGGTASAAPIEVAPGTVQPVYNQAGFAALVKQVKPAVVNISTAGMSRASNMAQMEQSPDFGDQDSPFNDMMRQFFQHRGNQGRGVPERAMGSGFIVDPAGYIVTNNHVIDHADKITVTLDDGSSFPAKVIGRDDKTDLALLKIEAHKTLPYVAFGNSDAEQVGDWVVAVGNPFGLGGTVTAGIVSAHGRNINEGPYDDFLQIDAPINPGNSGGPLFNQSGQVVGIDTAIYSPNGGSVGIGFAIPSNIASHVVAQLREHGSVSRGWLGVQMQPVTPALGKAIGMKEPRGVLVDDVTANSPASRADLKQGDVILAYNGVSIKDGRDLARDVANTASGQSANLTVWRAGQERTVAVTIGTMAKEKTASAAAEESHERVGMALAPLNSETREQLGLEPTARGVVVANVQPGSRADESGLQQGDVIQRVGDVAVTSPAEAVAKIHQAQRDKKEAVPLLVTRGGNTYYLALQLQQS
ncbi:MAG TPA: DegQ family serine endoprotease [Stellaceae bacterium]|nr:DegQ family serine endoprotease [Stellaceae bacterium]